MHYTLYICIIVFWYIHTHIKVSFFSDVNISVNGNHNILKFTFTLNVNLFDNQKFSYMYVPNFAKVELAYCFGLIRLYSQMDPC